MQINKNFTIKLLFININFLLFSSYIHIRGDVNLFSIEVYKFIDFFYNLSLFLTVFIFTIIFFKKKCISSKSIIIFAILNLLIFFKNFSEILSFNFIKEIIIFNSILIIFFSLNSVKSITFKDIDKNIDILNIFLLISVVIYFALHTENYQTIAFVFAFPNFDSLDDFYSAAVRIRLHNSYSWIVFIYFIINFAGYIYTSKNKYFYYIFTAVFYFIFSLNLYIKIFFVLLISVFLLFVFFRNYLRFLIYVLKYSFIYFFLISFLLVIFPFEKIYVHSNVLHTIVFENHDYKGFDFDKDLRISNYKILSSQSEFTEKYQNIECKYLKVCFDNLHPNYYSMKSVLERLEMQRIIKNEFFKDKKSSIFGYYDFSKFQKKNRVFTHNSYLNLLFSQGIIFCLLFIYILYSLLKPLSFTHSFQIIILGIFLALPMMDDYLFRNQIDTTILSWIFLTTFSKVNLFYET